MTTNTMSIPSFCKGMSEEKFDLLLDLSSWMKSNHDALIETNHCDESYLDIQREGEELSEAITEAGFSYSMVETMAFDLAE